MDDLISRQAAIDALVNTPSKVGYHDNSEVARYGATFRQHEILDIIERLSSVQPDHVADVSKKVEQTAEIAQNVQNGDLIQRKAAIEAVDTIGHIATTADGDKCIRGSAVKYVLSMLPSAQNTSSCAHENDLVSRKAAIEAINGMIDRFERLLADIVLPSAQPVITCDGCRFVSTYDTDFPCCSCVRREKDYYEPER